MRWSHGVKGALFAVAAGVLAARSAAAGTISGLAVDPSPACVDEEVTATVTGTGTCAELSVQWSAAAADLTTLTDVNFDARPVTAAHTYPAAGEFTVRVKPESPDCTMGAQVSLTVERCGLTIPAVPNDLLAGLTEALWTPRVEFAFGIIEPGGPLVVGGSQFGLAPGKVWIEGAFGTRQLTLTEHEGKPEWHNGGIGALMPPAGELTGMEGPADLTFELWVETAAGRVSNRWPLRLLEEVKALPRESVDVIACGDDGNQNFCNGVSHDGDFCFFPELLSSGYPQASIVGAHYNCLAAIGDDADTDRYRVRLANGWALESFDLDDNLPADVGHAVAPSGFERGATAWDPEVDWMVTPGDELIYGLQIYIVGPRGIPHE